MLGLRGEADRVFPRAHETTQGFIRGLGERDVDRFLVDIHPHEHATFPSSVTSRAAICTSLEERCCGGRCSCIEVCANAESEMSF